MLTIMEIHQASENFSKVPTNLIKSATNKEVRDLVLIVDKLRKEFQRKGSKIESLIKEKQSILASFNQQQV